MNGIRLALAPASPLKLSAGSDASAAGNLPTRVKLLGWGRNETSEGVVIVNELTARVFAANQKAIGRDRVPVDFEHNTVPGTLEFNRTSEPRATAGSSTLVCVPGEGIFSEAITYSATGQKSAPDFEDASLAPYLNKDGVVIGAHSWALTRTGAAYDIAFKQAPETLSADLKILSANSQPTTPHNMDLETLSAQIAGLAKTLGERLTALEQIKPVDLTTLSATVTDIQKKLADGEKTASDIKRGQLVTLFASQGKVPKKADGTNYSADELKTLGLDTLELLLANTAVTVPLSARTGAHQTENKKSFRVKVGDKELIDLGAIFDEENKKSGLTANPTV